ncbi:hypothetical protein BDZ94DRAFT_1240915 [Collybia nuda]|uniref:Uncharacterized protein n=1 Tax=Collybia nuda TaxID=64659 RepID=A0A9P5XUX5_9AGAR|nr:hypothetical protein BDZ94DRAFT_1240915 [Collybia nuda]
MPTCPNCSVTFPLMEPNDNGPNDNICKKCVMLDGKSIVEKVAIKAKGQCKGCSLVYANLEDPLCNGCCSFLVDSDAVPSSIIQLKGAMAQLAEFQKRYQSKASDHRLGLPRMQNASLQKATAAATSHFKKAPVGIAKGKTILADIQEQRANAGKVKITAGLWMMAPAKRGGAQSFVRVPQVQFSMRFEENMLIHEALGDIIKDAQVFHADSFPKVQPIHRQNVDVFAHESAAKAMCLPKRSLQNGTVGDLLKQFWELEYISASAAAAKFMEIRLYPGPPEMVIKNTHNSIFSSVPTASSKRKLSSATPNPWESGIRNLRKSYIGCGSAKHVIYARFGNEEYALGQTYQEYV